MIVYIDVVIVENLVINFFLLLITMQILSFKINYKTIFLSSILGAIYTLCMFFSELSFITTFPGKVLVALLMIYIILRGKDIGFIIKGVLTFFMISLMFCGLCFMFTLSQNDYNISKAFIIENYSIKYMMLAGMVIYILISRIIYHIKDRMIISKFIYDIEINIDDKVKTIRGFLDTGNELVEPITSLPVIIVEKYSFSDLVLSSKEQFNIPYKVVNGGTGTIKGVKAKEVRLFKEDGNTLSKEAIICFSEGTLSRNGDYEALLSRGMI